MGIELPAGAPTNTPEAFKFVAELKNGATIDDLKILALTEALGAKLYEDMAATIDNAEVKELLLTNGREEMRHALRVSEAIEILTGIAFPIPSIEQNPIYSEIPVGPVTRASLTKLAQGEFEGDNLYAGVAASFENGAVVALLRQNGREESEHGERLLKAAALID